MYPPGNGGCGGKIQEKNSLLVHDPKLQTMIENYLMIVKSALLWQNNWFTNK
jgi:hypothetical protein